MPGNPGNSTRNRWVSAERAASCCRRDSDCRDHARAWTDWEGAALSRELAVVLGDLRAGEPFTTAMERLAVRVPVPAVVRFVDGLVVAVERGTPLGDVLRAQAADVREQHKRDLIEAGGRREVLMLVPVVFLELPVVILFALYPGLFSLSQLAR